MAVELDSLTPRKANPNQGDVDYIAGLLTKFGAWKNIVYDRQTREILAGNHTWAAARKLGWKTFPAVGIDVSDTDAIEVLIGDNEASNLSHWDNQALLGLLETPGVDNDLLGFDDDALEKLRAELDDDDELGMPEPGDADIDDDDTVWGVVITCTDEAQQVELLDRFRTEGLSAKALMR